MTDFQSIRGNCPATGRSASVCADQSHATCYMQARHGRALDKALEREMRRIDGSY